MSSITIFSSDLGKLSIHGSSELGRIDFAFVDRTHGKLYELSATAQWFVYHDKIFGLGPTIAHELVSNRPIDIKMQIGIGATLVYTTQVVGMAYTVEIILPAKVYPIEMDKPSVALIEKNRAMEMAGERPTGQPAQHEKIISISAKPRPTDTVLCPVCDRAHLWGGRARHMKTSIHMQQEKAIHASRAIKC